MSWSRSLVIRGHSAPVYACTFLNNVLYSTAGDRFVTGWDVQSGSQLPFTLKSETPAYCLESIAENNQLIVGCANGNYLIVAPDSKKLLHERNYFGHGIFSIKHCPEQKWVVAGDAEGNLIILDYQGKLVVSFPLNCGKIRDIITTGTELFIACQDGTWRSFDLPTFNETRKQFAHKNGVNTLLYDSVGKTLISGGKDGHIRVWDLLTGTELLAFPAHYQTIYAIRKINNGFVSVSMDKTIKVWDENWKIVQRMEQPNPAHARSVNGCVMKDDSCFVTFSDDRTIAVWSRE